MDYKKALLAFQGYINNYDLNHRKISIKIDHSYGVVELSTSIARYLGLDGEKTELSGIIALLHDIGRFEQIKIYDNYDDHMTMDHADYACNILFEQGLIRNFVSDDKYDNIILKAIINHNKYEIKGCITEEELLYCKIIRDADKMDNFRIAISTNSEESIFIAHKITNEIYDDFMNCGRIDRKKVKTGIDRWIAFIAFIFDYNFDFFLKYVKEKECINNLFNRFIFDNEETLNKMREIRDVANNYIVQKLNSSF